MALVEAPTTDCPKCGLPGAFVEGNPEYLEPPSIFGSSLTYYVNAAGRLRWTCSRCGFELMTVTADYEPPPPRPPIVYEPPPKRHWWQR